MIAGIHYVRVRRAGKPIAWYVYAWRGGPQIMRSEGPAKPKLSREALDNFNQALEGISTVKRDTLGGLAREWRTNSPEWRALAPSTKKVWGSQLVVIEDKWGSTPITLWNDSRMVRKVIAWRDSRASTPRSADMGVGVLRALLRFGRERAAVRVNVADGIRPIYHGGTRAEIIWTDDDITKFTAKAIELGQQHIADGLRLAALTGLRRADLVTLTWAQVEEFSIVKKALKSSRRRRRVASIPRIPELDALLEVLKARHREEGVQSILVNSYGRPWTADGFGGSFNRIRDAAGIAHVDEETGVMKKKHLHDVRGTFATKLIAQPASLSDQQVADMMAWSPQQVADIRRVYVDQARVVVAIGERIRRALVNAL